MSDKGIADLPVEVIVDGEPMRVRSGQTVAALLIDHDRLSWRRTRFGDRPRGVLCGIGACFDCLITLNGRPNVRACLAWIQDGDVVTTEARDAR